MFAHGGFVVRSHPDCPFAVLAGCHNPLQRPHDPIEPKAGSFGDGVVANDDAVAATSTQIKTGRGLRKIDQGSAEPLLRRVVCCGISCVAGPSVDRVRSEDAPLSL